MKNLYKSATPAVANIGALKPHHRRPQSSLANTYRKEPIDKKTSIDGRFSKNWTHKRPISAIKVYKSTSSRTAMRAETATADSTNEMTMFSMAGASS